MIESVPSACAYLESFCFNKGSDGFLQDLATELLEKKLIVLSCFSIPGTANIHRKEQSLCLHAVLMQEEDFGCCKLVMSTGFASVKKEKTKICPEVL